MKKKYEFSMIITRIVEYDDEDQKLIVAYGGAEFIDDMVDLDLKNAKDDSVTFFIDGGDWGEPQVKEI
jgi:acetylglutamate kinase